ncbi:MAG: hypothetical protein QOF43_64 [Gaiellaceae bacterium]|nr:hypothetical protein [Gaiellaceae bacterium]
MRLPPLRFDGLVEGSYLFQSRVTRVPNTLLRWYRRLRFAAGRSSRSASPAVHRSRAAAARSTFETKVLRDHSTRFGSTERFDHAVPFDEELNDGNNREEYAVHAWRAEQLQRLGLTPTLAEEFAGHVDWHQVARLVEGGCSAHLALEIVR